MVIYSLRVGIFTMDILCIYAHVLYTLIILQVYSEFFIVFGRRFGDFWWQKPVFAVYRRFGRRTLRTQINLVAKNVGSKVS